MKLGHNKLPQARADVIIGSLLMGIIGGTLGAAFVIINNKINYFRKKILK